MRIHKWEKVCTNCKKPCSGIHEKRTCGGDDDTGGEAEAGEVGPTASFLKLAEEEGVEAGVE